jgi:4a-hydroxytetrahydrobiopterin dehydratase
VSERGWQDFLAADGVDDWVVLHGGATAVFRVASLGEAARLGQAITEASGFEGSGALLTITDAGVTVRLTRDLWALEERHIELARAVSAVARRHGAVADRAAVQEVQLAISAKPDAVDVGFWRAVLGYARWPTTTASTRWATDRRSGCRSSPRPNRCGTRCTSMSCASPVSTARHRM